MSVRMRIVSSVFTILLLVGGAPAAGAHGPDSAAVDLAAVTLRPGDLSDPGWLHEGAFYEDISSAAEITAGYLGEGTTPESVETELRAAGWSRMHVGLLILPGPAGAQAPAQLIRTAITEYQNEAGAAAGFAYLEDESAVSTAADLPSSPAFGDESELTTDQGTSSVDGRPYRSLDLSFRLGRFTASVALVAYGDEPVAAPVQTVVTRLAGVVEVRLRTPPAANLGLRVTRFESAEHVVLTYDDAYYRLGGADVPLINEAADVAKRRAASYAAATDVYQLWQGIDVGATHGVLYGVTALAFETPESAEAWLDGLPERVADNPFYGSPVEITIPQRIAGQAVVISYVSGGSDKGRSMLVAARVGAEVVRVHLVPEGFQGNVALEPMLAIAQINAECLGGADCPPLTTLPQSLFG